MENELKETKEQYSSFDQHITAKNKELEIKEKLTTKLEKELKDLRMQFNRQRAQLLDYEERYKGIDITRMHEEIETLKTKAYGHQV